MASFSDLSGIMNGKQATGSKEKTFGVLLFFVNLRVVIDDLMDAGDCLKISENLLQKRGFFLVFSRVAMPLRSKHYKCWYFLLLSLD